MTCVLFAGGGTGGHLYPALALGAALRAQRPDIEVHYVGARRGVEARVLPQQQVPHTLLPLQPIQRDRIWRNWKLGPALGATFVGLARLFARLRPALVVGTGGYASGPACMWAVLTAIPIALQEQNSHPGFTTRMLSRFARQVHLGFPEAAGRLRPGARTEVLALGNPIRPPDPGLDRTHCRREFGIADHAVVLLVVGGSQGSLALNEALLGALALVDQGELPGMPDSLEILWATGPAHLDNVRARLAGLRDARRVHVLGYIEAMPHALAAADVALSRAGAMATAELLAWGVPMVLVPLPTAAADHQTFNAQALAAAGAAISIPERELTPEHLWRELLALATDQARRVRMTTAARERARPDAARDIARALLRLVA
ncbi:MAG TPA: undecaprenyldiphospho-muramoylpentapeptide beta-N-acetylglucosaminyltransferase [Longimicrobiales bacterium]|nr:undecaprenyldiphospho-muramoylpentapeptide beta-N-acetylglucosaminyltransferase [Longimicrobiales bacterium]